MKAMKATKSYILRPSSKIQIFDGVPVYKALRARVRVDVFFAKFHGTGTSNILSRKTQKFISKTTFSSLARIMSVQRTK